jgi:hypothetical protein
LIWDGTIGFATEVEKIVFFRFEVRLGKYLAKKRQQLTDFV